MSNHFSAANLKSPGDDARLDLTDLFVFAAPGNPGKTVLIMNSNPFTQGHGFHPDAVYRFNIDTDGDALADVAFSFTFSALDNGRQTATAYYATGRDAQTREPRGDILIEAPRSASTPPRRPSPPLPAVHRRPQRPLLRRRRRRPALADRRPDRQLRLDRHRHLRRRQHPVHRRGGPQRHARPRPGIGTWITTSLRRDGTLVPMDREGNPSFNPILNPNGIKDQFNATDPADDVANYLQPLSEALHQHGYPPGEAAAAARTLLPDILHFDRTRPAHYPNGRVMTDDVFSARMIFMVHGQATPQPIRPHDDLLAAFPFLGKPNP